MHPPYMNSNGSISFYNHETLNLKITNMQSINSDVNCLTGKIIRSCKKDRHRKINTARGPKDRRMRLSLDVATKFFRLQDMLGFDKASHTIQWLLMKSKPAIRDLQQSNQSSECEALQSGIDEKKRVDQKEVRKIVYIDHTLAKETREKARARARKRTTEKRNIIKLGSNDQYSKLRPSGLGPLFPFGEDQVQLTDQADQYPSSNFQFKQGIVGDDSSMMSGNFSPSFLLNYQHNLGPSLHMHQFSDFQILGKPWEGINSYI